MVIGHRDCGPLQPTQLHCLPGLDGRGSQEGRHRSLFLRIPFQCVGKHHTVLRNQDGPSNAINLGKDLCDFDHAFLLPQTGRRNERPAPVIPGTILAKAIESRYPDWGLVAFARRGTSEGFSTHVATFGPPGSTLDGRPRMPNLQRGPPRPIHSVEDLPENGRAGSPSASAHPFGRPPLAPETLRAGRPGGPPDGDTNSLAAMGGFPALGSFGPGLRESMRPLGYHASIGHSERIGLGPPG